MKKANIIRAIFWGIVFLIVLALGVIGLLTNNKNYENYKDDLSRIVNIFNSNRTIINYENYNTHIMARVRGKKIIVTSEGTLENTYVFSFKQNHLETVIDSNDTLARVIVMVMTDSIAVNKGGFEEETYEIFRNDEVLSYTFDQGIEFTTQDYKYKIKMNLDNCVSKPKAPEENENDENNESSDENNENEDQVNENNESENAEINQETDTNNQTEY